MKSAIQSILQYKNFNYPRMQIMISYIGAF